MKYYHDVMLDLETFGNGKNACIVQIGACFFDRRTGDIGKTFKCNVDARSSVASGAEMDADTVYWWLDQSDNAINSICDKPLLGIQTAMQDLNLFLEGADNIWSHATFDFVIIQETFKRLNIKPLFSYRFARDIRTLVELAGVKTGSYIREGVHHDALADCFHQVRYCTDAIKKLWISK